MYFGGYVFRNESFVFRNMDCIHSLLRSFSVGVFATEERGRVRGSGALKGLYVPRGTILLSPLSGAVCDTAGYINGVRCMHNRSSLQIRENPDSMQSFSNN